jgi:Microtubule-binding protein MIP-T3.
MEFVSDDIESMKKEFERWNAQYMQGASRMEDQKKVTEDELSPFYNKIAEIEEQIKETQMKIRNTTAQILKNQETIKSFKLS